MLIDKLGPGFSMDSKLWLKQYTTENEINKRAKILEIFKTSRSFNIDLVLFVLKSLLHVTLEISLTFL